MRGVVEFYNNDMKHLAVIFGLVALGGLFLPVVAQEGGGGASAGACDGVQAQTEDKALCWEKLAAGAAKDQGLEITNEQWDRGDEYLSLKKQYDRLPVGDPQRSVLGKRIRQILNQTFDSPSLTGGKKEEKQNDGGAYYGF